MQTKENRPAQAAEIAYNVEYTSFQPENQ
ncbi:MAG: hypothetical protein PWR01_2960, partial [Clostridiales bacterium]|nr:hypothetical protein [Clostridiales bacterium]MDN5281887.1 hypothetical protein [Candidatus Ozemobacter sp.]